MLTHKGTEQPRHQPNQQRAREIEEEVFDDGDDGRCVGLFVVAVAVVELADGAEQDDGDGVVDHSLAEYD